MCLSASFFRSCSNVYRIKMKVRGPIGTLSSYHSVNTGQEVRHEDEGPVHKGSSTDQTLNKPSLCLGLIMGEKAKTDLLKSKNFPLGGSNPNVHQQMNE